MKHILLGIFSFFAIAAFPVHSSARLTQNVLVNGDFEGSASPWILSGRMFYAGNDPSTAYSGKGHVYFKPAYRSKSEMYQDVTVPAAGATLSYMLRIDSTVTAFQIDWFTVGISSLSNAAAPSSVKVYTNMDNTGLSYRLGSINLNNYAGQRVRITFGGNSQFYSGSYATYHVDAISVFAIQ